MPCESMRKRKNRKTVAPTGTYVEFRLPTLHERAAEVKEAVARLADAIVKGRAKVVIGPKGEIAFTGITDDERDGVTDACAYRRIMTSGSALARMQIAKAEQLAGRSVNKQLVGQGAHSHDGGKTWHDHKG